MAWLFWSSFHWQVVRAIGVFSVKSLAFLIEYWMATCLLGEHHNHIFFFWESFWIFGVNVSWEESQAWTTTVPSLATALVRTVLRQVRACLAVVKHNLESFCWMICMTAQETITAWCLGWLFCVDQGETTGTSFSFISLRPDLTPGLQCSYRPSNPWLLIWSYQGWLVWPTRWYCVNLRVSSVGLAVSNNLVFARVQTHWYCPPYHQFPY